MSSSPLIDSFQRRHKRGPYRVALTREEATHVTRSIFRRCGYCIAEHGTKGRDLDLVAVPWTDRAGMPNYIVRELMDALPGVPLGDRERKPHSRVAYAIQPDHRRKHDLWYLDLSIVVPEKYSADEYLLLEQSKEEQ